MASNEDVSQSYLQQLIYKYAGNSCTREEMDELLEIVNRNDNQKLIDRAFLSYWELVSEETGDRRQESADFAKASSAKGRQESGSWDRKFFLMMEELRISNKEQGISNVEVDEALSTRGIGIPEHKEVEGKVKWMQVWKYVAAAAVVMGLVVAGWWFYSSQQSTGSDQPGVAVQTDVKAPESNRAMITLSDGRVVYLDSAGNGSLANVSGVEVIKLSDGKIVYKETGDRSQETVYNTLTNPRGSKVIDMTLSDGSRVWLNAGSSVTYPVVFVGNERKVTMRGEAYFEVNKVSSEQSVVSGKRTKGGYIPFIVSNSSMEVEVLGTQFNVNAYEDEQVVRVTLLEGSVRVRSQSTSTSLRRPGESGVRRQEILKPGQQARLVSSELSVVSGVDLEAVMAWKNGKFVFNRASLQEVMRQLSRWYDVEVVYEAQPSQRFGGQISRSSNLSQVLEILKASGVKFRIENKRVVVLK